ncbi:hypothetical protein [Bradyrhizobium sp.]
MINHGRFQPPVQRVSITNGQTQIEFESPGDFAIWYASCDLSDTELSEYWFWTTEPVKGGH